MATFILKRLFSGIEESLFSERSKTIKNAATKEYLVASHLLMYMTVDVSNNTDEDIKHWSISEIPMYTGQVLESFKKDWKSSNYKYVFPTFLGDEGKLSYSSGVGSKALEKIASECGNKLVWKLLFSDEYKIILNDYCNRLNFKAESLRKALSWKTDIPPIVSDMREDYHLYDLSSNVLNPNGGTLINKDLRDPYKFLWSSYVTDTTNRTTTEKDNNLKEAKSGKWMNDYSLSW